MPTTAYMRDSLLKVHACRVPLKLQTSFIYLLYVLLTPQTGLYYRIISRILAIIVLLSNFSLGYPVERPQVSVPNSCDTSSETQSIDDCHAWCTLPNCMLQVFCMC